MTANDNPTSARRWKAVCIYRSRGGEVHVLHYFDELHELHDLIERGPDWNTLISCIVSLNLVSNPGMVLECEGAA